MSLKNSSLPEKTDEKALSASGAEAAALFMEILKRGAALRTKVAGRSMRPSLMGGETVVVEPADASLLGRGDMVLFRNTSGLPVLHRLVRKKKTDDGSYVLQTKGDALFSPDEPFCEADLMGRAVVLENSEGSKILMGSPLRRVLNYVLAIKGLLRFFFLRRAARLLA